MKETQLGMERHPPLVVHCVDISPCLYEEVN